MNFINKFTLILRAKCEHKSMNQILGASVQFQNFPSKISIQKAHAGETSNLEFTGETQIHVQESYIHTQQHGDKETSSVTRDQKRKPYPPHNPLCQTLNINPELIKQHS